MTNFGKEYHKIQGVFKRDGKGVIIPWDYTKPEFEMLSSINWVWTEKIDGTNIRLHYDGTNVTIGGRTNNAQIPADLVAALKPFTESLDFWKDKFNQISGECDVTIYGEGYGAGIQKVGKNYRKDKGFIVFDILVGDYWLERENVVDIAANFGMDVVPVSMETNLSEAIYVMALIAQNKGQAWEKSELDLPNNNAIIEGYVGHPKVELFNRWGERVITKIKVKDWVDYYNKK